MFLFYSFFFAFILDISYCSLGDRTYTFNKCISFCKVKFCKNDTFVSEKVLPQRMLRTKRGKFLNKLEFSILWRCPKECNYICMWKTVAAFKNDGLDVPQFFGKVIS